MGNLNFSLGKVQYDTLSLATFPMEARIGVGVGASIVALIVFIIVLIYRCVCVCVSQVSWTWRHLPHVGLNYTKIWLYWENVNKVVRNVLEYGIPNSCHIMYLGLRRCDEHLQSLPDKICCK